MELKANESSGCCLSSSSLLYQQLWTEWFTLTYLKHFLHLSASVTQQLSRLNDHFFLVFYFLPLEFQECPTAWFGVLFSIKLSPKVTTSSLKSLNKIVTLNSSLSTLYL